MTDFTEANKILDRTAAVRDKRLIAICIGCEHCKGTIIGNIGTGSDNEAITDYICSNPAKTGAIGKEIPVRHPVTCACKHSTAWAYDKRSELHNEIKQLECNSKLLSNRISELETKLDEKDQYIEELQKLLKNYEQSCFQEQKECKHTKKEVKNEPNPWDI